MSALPPPDERLKVSVVVPAHNEEELVGACLEALATQEGISPEEYEVILVLDNCSDSTDQSARGVSAIYPDFRLHFLDGPGKGAGHARRAGMDAACRRLLRTGNTSSLIASTDADSVVAQDWLSAQLKHAAAGARAIGGRIQLSHEANVPQTVSRWRQDRGVARHQSLLDEQSDLHTNVMEHWQFSGASLSLTPQVYAEIGGLEPLTALEDEYLERVLSQRGIPIERPLAVMAQTSARLNGRAERGLAQDLALASWYHGNTYHATDFDAEKLHRIKQTSVSLILTGDSYSATTASDIVDLRASGLLDEIIQVSLLPGVSALDPSVEFHIAAELMPHFGPIRGYGDLLWRAISATSSGIIVVLDADPEGSVTKHILGLIGPLLEHEELSLLKGFSSPPDQLSELVARPLINLYHPKLAGFTEPLSPNFAARSKLLRSLSFPVGAGIYISLLLDAAKHSGVEALAQSDLGSRPEHSYPVDTESAYAIMAAAASRAPEASAGAPVAGPLFVPGPQYLDTHRVPVEERPPLNSHAASNSVLH